MTEIDPTIADFGTEIAGRYVVTGNIGTFGGDSVCDHPGASRIGDRCRCIVCSRCGKHTGNAHQGHYWAFCQVTKTRRDFHLCCPGDCELEAGLGDLRAVLTDCGEAAREAPPKDLQGES